MDALIYVLSINGLIFLISLAFYYVPPKNINKIYGYKTHRTMQNKNCWDFANHLFSITLLKYSGISLMMALVLTFLNPTMMSSWVPMGLMIVTLLLVVMITEKGLNENFDQEGNRKTKK